MVDPIPGHEHLRGRMAIPYLTKAGPVNMNFRCIQNHECKEFGHQKYMMMPGLQTNLYHVKSIDAAGDYIALAEGEVDTMSCNFDGVPTVGVSGSKKWQPWWNEIFSDFSTVYVFTDGDKAGREFGDMVQSEIPTTTRVVLIPMPDREDPNSIWVKEGPGSLKKRIRT